MTAANGSICKLEAEEELMEGNGDGAIILSPKCIAQFLSCTITGSVRCGARICRGARGFFERCRMSFNGRGIAVAATSAAEVRNCNFSDNVGWAVRLEDAPSGGAGLDATSN